jgi:hypothetical protein
VSRGKIFFSSVKSRLDRPYGLLFNRDRSYFTGVKRPEPETGNRYTSSAEVKNEWRRISTSLSKPMYIYDNVLLNPS